MRIERLVAISIGGGNKGNLSSLEVSRTTADLGKSKGISTAHQAEALQYSLRTTVS